MDYKVLSDAPATHATHCLVVGVFEDGRLSDAAVELDQASGQQISKILESGDLEGKAGQTLLLRQLPGLAAERVLLMGCGDPTKFRAKELTQAITAAAKQLQETGATHASFFLDGLEVEAILRHATQAIEQACYRFDQTKSKKNGPKYPLTEARFLVPDTDIENGREQVRIGAAIGQGVALACDLGNLPGNICTPTYLAEQAQSLAQRYGFKTTILEEKDMESLGMGALLSVSRGSRQPAKLIVMEYSGGGNEAPVALVGKGLTFDAGGISIKPSAAMDEMKYDMCGGASVFGVVTAIAELKLPINVIGIVPSSENLPDGNANKPGDIVTSMSGQTIEILNTDAEGRLILCDALTYCKRFKPQAVIDIATLTGACVIALGGPASGLMSNNDELATEILACGTEANDRAWQLPLWDEYQQQLDSNFADMANIGGREAGAVTAACFLSRYTEDLNWAHLDIAGTAWTKGKTKGATGRPVALLTQFCLNRAGGPKQ